MCYRFERKLHSPERATKFIAMICLPESAFGKKGTNYRVPLFDGSLNTNSFV